MSTTSWILMLLLGGFLGVLGQGIRVIPGLKKLNDQATAQKPFGELFQLSRLLLSLFIGLIAGALAVLIFMEPQADVQIDRQMVITILGAGYAGTDFIEGFTKKLPMGK